MSSGRGSKAGGKNSAGLLGMKGAGASRSSSGQTGPNPGLGVGQRDPGTPEDTKFQRKDIHPNELGPGQITGVLPTDGEAPKGEVQVPVVGETQAALQRMAEKIDTEVLPVEYREQILRYMESLRQTLEGEKVPEGEGR
jgi:hypothetical protein